MKIIIMIFAVLTFPSCSFLIRNSECSICNRYEACIPAIGRHYMCIELRAPRVLLPSPAISRVSQ